MPRFAEYSAEVDKNGNIRGLLEATPAQELGELEIVLTKQEYALLSALRGNMNDFEKLANSIKYKINEAISGKYSPKSE